MRKELEYHKADKAKLEQVKALIGQIADREGDVDKALEELGKITGKQHSEMEFAEYWGWTELDDIAELTLTAPPFVSDLTRDELIEIIAIIKETLVNCADSEGMYYEELLHRSLPLTDVLGHIRLEDDNDKIADEMLSAAKTNVILL